MSTLEITTYIGIAIGVLLALVIIIGSIGVWFWRRRRDEEEDTTDPEADDDTDPDPKSSSPAPGSSKGLTYEQAAAENHAIRAFDKDVYRGIQAMLERADNELTAKLRRETINPLLRQLRRTRLALLVVTVILAGAMAALWGTRPTNVDLYLHGSTTDEDGNLVTLDQRLATIEEFVVMNTVTSPIVISNMEPPIHVSFTSMQDLLTQLSTASYSLTAGYEGLEGVLGSTFDIVAAMVPYLDHCYDERTSDTPDENGCYDLSCTLGTRTFIHPHRWNPATSSWSPCD